MKPIRIKTYHRRRLRREKTIEQRLLFKLRAFQLSCLGLLLIIALIVYNNYDYFVFKLLISVGYSYTDTLDELYSQQLKRESTVTGRYFRDFDNMVIGVVSEKIRSLNNDRYTYLYTPEYLTLEKELTKEDALLAEIKEVAAGVGYMRLPNISEHTQKFVMDNKSQLGEFDSLIIDLRSNYGGYLWVLYDIADLFLEKGTPIGAEVTRIFGTSEKKTSGKKILSYDKIILLQNKNTASAAEGLINALRENLDNVTVIGERSFGKGIGQVTLPLKRGYAVKATVLRVQTPTGGSIHQVGIEPDIECDENTDAYDKALEFLGL